MRRRPSLQLRRALLCSSGQSLLEFALVMPVIMMLALGVVEFGWVLLDQHVVTKLTREGSNLISRDASIQETFNALKNMSTRPVDFTSNSKVIFSVLRNVPTVGATNYNKVILYQRFSYGSLANASVLTAGGGSFSGPPDYLANNADNDASLQITNLPANLTIATGGMLYVTEIYTRHTLLTPLDRFGITLPQTLYSSAFF